MKYFNDIKYLFPLKIILTVTYITNLRKKPSYFLQYIQSVSYVPVHLQEKRSVLLTAHSLMITSYNNGLKRAPSVTDTLRDPPKARAEET